MAKWSTLQTYCITLFSFLPEVLFGRSYLYCSPQWLYLYPKPTPSGLPRGAVLLFTLSSLFLSDMPHPPHTNLALFADGTVLPSQSWKPNTISCRLINTVTTLLKYFNMWKLWLNTHKTETILFSKCHPPSWTLFKSRTPLCPGPWPSAT